MNIYIAIGCFIAGGVSSALFLGLLAFIGMKIEEYEKANTK